MRIVCLDDDELVAEITTALLVELGHEVLQSSSGEHALGLIAWASEPIDMLITDIHLANGTDGPSVALCARELLPDLQVLFFTGDGAFAGIDGLGVLRKPCTLGVLDSAIGSAAQRRFCGSNRRSPTNAVGEVGVTAWTMHFGTDSSKVHA